MRIRCHLCRALGSRHELGCSSGYTREDAVQLIYLEAVGPHENFYRDLKRA
nr:type II toxin-antitoxin system RelE/ParE family toxin [Allochromatium warmingii]